MSEAPVVKASNFYTREELAQYFPPKKLLKIKKRYTFVAQSISCIYGDILVDLSGKNIIPEKLLASMLLYSAKKDLFDSEDISVAIETYQTGYTYHHTGADSDPVATLITLLCQSHKKMTCLCHLWLARLLGAKRFECLQHGESGKIPGNHKLFSKYEMDTKTPMEELVNWVVSHSKAIIPYVVSDNVMYDEFLAKAMEVGKRINRVLKFFAEFCNFDKTEIDYLLTVLDSDIDIVQVPTMNPDILPNYLQERYKAALMGTTNAKGKCSTCYLKKYTKVNCVIHSDVQVREEAPVEQSANEMEPVEKTEIVPEEAQGKECTICYAKKPTHVAVPCGHAYCGACIERVYKEKKSCAFCKRTMTFPMEIRWV